MGLGQGLEQRRGVLAGELEVADQDVDGLGVEPQQCLGQVARAVQLVVAGGAEVADAGQGVGVVVQQQHVERRGQPADGLQVGHGGLAPGDLRRLAQGEGHFLRVPGLGQVAEDAAVVQRFHRRVQVGIAGEQDAQAVRGDLAGPGQQLGAAHLRHALVADENLHRLAAQALQGAPRVGLGEHLVVPAELHGQAAQDAFLVVDEEDAGQAGGPGLAGLRQGLERLGHVRHSVSGRWPARAAGG